MKRYPLAPLHGIQLDKYPGATILTLISHYSELIHGISLGKYEARGSKAQPHGVYT